MRVFSGQYTGIEMRKARQNKLKHMYTHMTEHGLQWATAKRNLCKQTDDKKIESDHHSTAL